MKKILALLVAIMMLAMTIPTLAEAPAAEQSNLAGYVPSIKAKPAPSVVDDVKFFHADGTSEAVAAGELVITPLADIYDETKTVAEDTVALLTWAYESLLEGADVVAIQPEIEKALEGTEVTFDQLVARDLFEVSAYGNLAKWLEEEEGSYVEFILDAIFAENQTAVVLYADHAEEPVWQVLPAPETWWLTEAVEEICNVGMKTGDLGVFAFLVVADSVPAVVSPAE